MIVCAIHAMKYLSMLSELHYHGRKFGSQTINVNGVTMTANIQGQEVIT